MDVLLDAGQRLFRHGASRARCAMRNASSHSEGCEAARLEIDEAHAVGGDLELAPDASAGGLRADGRTARCAWVNARGVTTRALQEVVAHQHFDPLPRLRRRRCPSSRRHFSCSSCVSKIDVAPGLSRCSTERMRSR